MENQQPAPAPVPQPAASPEQIQPVEAAKSNNPMMMIIGLLVVGLVVIGGIVGFLVLTGDEDSDNDEETSEESQDEDLDNNSAGIDEETEELLRELGITDEELLAEGEAFLEQLGIAGLSAEEIENLSEEEIQEIVERYLEALFEQLENGDFDSIGDRLNSDQLDAIEDAISASVGDEIEVGNVTWSIDEVEVLGSELDVLVDEQDNPLASDEDRCSALTGQFVQFKLSVTNNADYGLQIFNPFVVDADTEEIYRDTDRTLLFCEKEVTSISVGYVEAGETAEAAFIIDMPRSGNLLMELSDYDFFGSDFVDTLETGELKPGSDETYVYVELDGLL